LQLIITSDESHVWSEIFDGDWKDVFSVQNKIAEAVAKQLQAVITPEEIQLIRKTPTTNLTAYDYYLRGKDELEKYEFGIKRDTIILKKAQQLFQKALDSDSTFALAYTGLAAVQFWTSGKNYLSENYLDSVLILANKALTYDNQCSEAYYYRGYVYSETSKTTEALKEIDKALKFNPNYWKAYYLRSFIFEAFHDDVGSISNLYEAVRRNRGSGLPKFLMRFSYNLTDFGFPDLAKKYNQQAMELHGDSTRYLYCLAYTEYADGNFEKAYQIARSSNNIDSTYGNLDLSVYCMITGRYEEAYSLSLKISERLKKSGEIDPSVFKRIAYYLWQTGSIKEAESYFKRVIKYQQECIKLGRLHAIEKWYHFDLAEQFAFLGDKEKAYYYLDEVNKNQAFPLYWVILFQHEPFFNSFRHEPRFQKILKDVEAKYQAEHERVGKWLEEKGLL
jgi:tetratricopeptide (TPR) repeat protein